MDSVGKCVKSMSLLCQPGTLAMATWSGENAERRVEVGELAPTGALVEVGARLLLGTKLFRGFRWG